MENKEDILKEFEDIKIEQISNDSFDIELIKGQFGETQLSIRPHRRGDTMGTIFGIIFGLIILILIYNSELVAKLLCLTPFILFIFSLNTHSHVVITKGKIIIKKVIFKQQITVKSIHTKNINYLKTKTETGKSEDGVVIRHNLYLNFSSGKEMLLFKSGDKYDVRDLELVIKKFIGIEN
mgnify:CR=1 FL=1